ncbi:MAG: phage holin family protein, partial [Isosphaeraceae bacterium]
AALAMGGLPVLLFGLAELVHQYGGMPLGWALVLTAVVALVVAAIVGAVAALRLSRCFESFRRSREELVRNVSWIKTVLAYSGRASASGRGR